MKKIYLLRYVCDILPFTALVQLAVAMTLTISDLPTKEVQFFLQHLVAPRPIALASTIDNKGNANLSPFSFFNMFSSNPAIVIFSPARRLRNNTTKDTLNNLDEVPEVVIHMVTHDILHQASLASVEYPAGVDEFVKAGFTKRAATYIKPPIVAEAKASLECKVKEIKSLGDNGGAGQLVIAEVICMHIDESLSTASERIEQQQIDHVARLGGDWYAMISAANLIKVRKPNHLPAIGFDALPAFIRNSKALTNNHLAQLAGVSEVPVLQKNFRDDRLDAIMTYFKPENNLNNRVHHYAKELIDDGDIDHAWQVLLSFSAVCV